MLKTLTPREEAVLESRFGLGGLQEKTLEEVGKQFEVTRERIRQIETKSIRKLRHPARAASCGSFRNERRGVPSSGRAHSSVVRAAGS